MEKIKHVEIQHSSRAGKVFFPDFEGYKLLPRKLADIAGKYGYPYVNQNIRATATEKGYLLLNLVKEIIMKQFSFDKKKVREIKKSTIENLVIYKRDESFKYGVRLSCGIEAYIDSDMYYLLIENFPNPIKRN